MKIVIAGDGKVGYTLAEQLSREGHDITIIDSNAQALGETLETLDVMGVVGNGASYEILVEAGAAQADLLIAATSLDEVNMLCCLTARNIGAKNTIARVRNPEYFTQLKMLREIFGLSMVINPELEAAREIARIISFPAALRVDTFAGGRVELIEFKLLDGMKPVGRKLMELPKLTSARVLVCAVERGGSIVIPDGSFVPEAGDRLHISGESRQIAAFLNQIGNTSRKIRSILMVGGGRICYYLAKMLDDDRSYQVKIIEKNRARCEFLCEALPRAVIIHADGSDPEILESEGVDSIDAFVALTNIDEENLMMSMVAHYKEVPKTITKTARYNYMAFMEKSGIDSVVNPKLITANQIIQYVRAVQNSEQSSHVQTLYKLVGGKAEALEFVATEQTRNLGVSLLDLRLKKNLLLAVIVREGRVIIPGGRDSIHTGDHVVVLTGEEHRLSSLNDIFAVGAAEPLYPVGAEV